MRYCFLSLVLAASAATVQPALAQDDYVRSVQSAQRTPTGVTARVGVTVPLGPAIRDERRTTFNVTAGYGQRFESNRPLEQERTRGVELAQFNFDSDGARDLQVANFSLTTFGREDVGDQRLNAGGTGTTLAIIGGVLVAVVVVAFLTADEEDFIMFDDDV